MVFAEMRKP